MQMRIHLIKEGISAQARNRAERVDRARGNISRRRRTRGKGGSPFTPFPCEVLFIFRPISNYQDERAGERTEKRTTERESRRQRRKGGGIRGGGGRDSSFGLACLVAVCSPPSSLSPPSLPPYPPVPLFRASPPAGSTDWPRTGPGTAARFSPSPPPRHLLSIPVETTSPTNIFAQGGKRARGRARERRIAVTCEASDISTPSGPSCGARSGPVSSTITLDAVNWTVWRA
jgi:hypothetical protein